MIALLQKRWPTVTETEVDGQMVEVAVRVSSRARNYRLSLPHAGGPILTVPSHGRWQEAQAFLNRQRAWLGARLERAAKPVSFTARGAVIPLRGVDHKIVPTGRIRGRVEVLDKVQPSLDAASKVLSTLGSGGSSGLQAQIAQIDQGASALAEGSRQRGADLGRLASHRRGERRLRDRDEMPPGRAAVELPEER